MKEKHTMGFAANDGRKNDMDLGCKVEDFFTAPAQSASRDTMVRFEGR